MNNLQSVHIFSSQTISYFNNSVVTPTMCLPPAVRINFMILINLHSMSHKRWGQHVTQGVGSRLISLNMWPGFNLQIL